MKKFFAFAAVALVAFSFASCNKGGEGEGDATIKVNISEGVKFTDVIDDYGFWQIQAQNDLYYITLSNSEDKVITKPDGMYTVEDLDPDYSFIEIIATETEVAFTEGSITVTVENNGKKVIVIGKLTGDDGNVYELNLVYIEPEAKKTVNVNIPEGMLYDGYSAYGLWGVYGYNEDSTEYVQLGIWADELAGTFTEDDLDPQYIGSFVADMADESMNDIFTADITITPSNDDNISISADLLCYNNTLYKVTMITPAPAAAEEGGSATAPKKLAAKKVIAKKGAKKLAF